MKASPNESDISSGEHGSHAAVQPNNDWKSVVGRRHSETPCQPAPMPTCIDDGNGTWSGQPREITGLCDCTGAMEGVQSARPEIFESAHWSSSPYYEIHTPESSSSTASTPWNMQPSGDSFSSDATGYAQDSGAPFSSMFGVMSSAQLAGTSLMQPRSDSFSSDATGYAQDSFSSVFGDKSSAQLAGTSLDYTEHAALPFPAASQLDLRAAFNAGVHFAKTLANARLGLSESFWNDLFYRRTSLQPRETPNAVDNGVEPGS